MKIASILKKVLMAVTGLALAGFLVGHLAGNLKIYVGADSFNAYARFLDEFELVPIAEGGLIVLFLIHIVNAFKLTMENKAARPQAYAVRQTAGESTFASRTMWFSGLVIFVFVVFHIWHFKFGNKRVEGKLLLWELVASEFEKPAIMIFYVFCLLTLGLHISHGIASAFQSLGLFSKNRRKLRAAGMAAGWLIAIGFAAIPVYCFIAKPAHPVVATPVKVVVPAPEKK